MAKKHSEEKKKFDHSNPKNKRALDDLGKWIEKHAMTVHETMDIMSDFFAFMALKSGDPAFFMKQLTNLLVFHLERHNNSEK